MTEAMPRFQTGGNRRILVVEDEPINQEILRAILKDSFEIVVTATGTECLEIVRTQAHSLSLILLDLNLPDMHGLEVLRQLKAEERLAGLPVIVMTADVDTEVESLTLGAIDFIPKPYPQPAVIRARVTRTIELVEDRDIIRGTERDRLTGLYNREFFDRYCGQLDAWLPDQPMDAIAIDINHFHIFNERYGKTAGDNLLRQVGRILSETLKDEQSVICRQGADTFLVYRPHRNDYEQMMKALSVKEKEGMDSTPVRMRMGVYANADRSLEIQRRFDRAKQAADSVRSSFHRAIGMYDDKMRKTEVFHEQLLDSFETALREGQFQVWYQPKYNIQKEPFTVCSAEALIRWNHPAMGMISPAVFIPLFEQNGLIQELDRFVWQEAARQVREWKETLGISVPVSVNVSRVDLYDPNIVSHLFDLANRNQLTYGELLLEVTESAYTANSEQIVEKVQMLRERGFRIEMDDFGSGYSSLNMLSELPIDALKLDMEFIRGAFRKRKDTRLLEAVIRLAESLEVPTIAEGVETAEQLLALKSMGCDIVQGYYFSKPLPADEFMAFIRENQRPDLAPPESGTKAEQPDDGSKSIRQTRQVFRNQFTYDALHDNLTGLYNNTAFEILFHDSDQEHIAVVIVEINEYERIRKNMGKQTADEAVKYVADTLKSQFRSADHICRLKENEFVMILTRVTSVMQDMIFEKMDQISERLRDNQSDAGPLTLSVGIAFSDRKSPGGDIFQDADMALQRMKQVRHSGCAVY